MSYAAQDLGPPFLALAFVRTRGGPAGTGDKGRREGVLRGHPLLGPNRTEPGWTRCPLPREQRRQLWGELPDPAPGGENVGLGARHRHGTGCTGTWLLCPRSHPQHAALSVPGGLSTAGGGSARLGGGAQGLGCAPVLCIAVAVHSRPEHPRVLPGAVRRGHPGDSHRGGTGGAAEPALAPGVPARPRGSSGSRPGLEPCAQPGAGACFGCLFGIHLKKK